MNELCPYCHGLGKVRYYHGDFDTCPTCHGAGYVHPDREMTAAEYEEFTRQKMAIAQDFIDGMGEDA